MTTPTTKHEFKEYCLRKLGWPVLEINMSDEQLDDRVDEALQYYRDYHYDGVEKVYYKHLITEYNFPRVISEVQVINGGTLYSNSDTLTFTSSTGTGAAGNVVTYANGTISSIIMTAPGDTYNTVPTITINTSTGSGANLQAYIGGYIALPENLHGAVRIFDVSSYLSSSGGLFDIRYQFALNDLYAFTNQSIVPFYMMFQHIQFMSQLLVGQQPIRYNKHTNRLYIDMNWNKVKAGSFLVVEAHRTTDPNVYTDVWNDRWLQNYATALIKRQWGTNLIKFNNIQMPGGTTFNGQKIYDDAVIEINELEREMQYSLSSIDMIG